MSHQPQMPDLRIKIDFAQASDPGRDPGKQANEDSCGYAETRFGHLIVLCDGMGSHYGGREASLTAIRAIFEQFEQMPATTIPVQALKAAIEEAGRRVYQLGGPPDNRARPSSTVVAMLLHDRGINVAHVGDSRAYIIRSNQIYPLTRDHSTVQGMIDAGTLTEETALGHPDLNTLTRVLGMLPDVDVELRPDTSALYAGDILIQCSDGLTELALGSDILAATRQALANGGVEHACDQLVQLANDRGGRGNITVQMARVIEVGSSVHTINPKRSVAEGPVDVFISYTPEDEALCRQLEEHLAVLKRDGVIRAWHQRLIGAGAEFRKEARARLISARVVVVLVSSSYLASDAYDHELTPALARAQKGATLLVPVLVRPVDAEKAPFSGYTPLPRNGVAVTSWSNHDEAWVEVAAGIRKQIEALTGTSTTGPTKTGTRKRAPRAEDAAKRLLEEQLDEARARRQLLLEAGVSTTVVDGEILDLRRQLRVGVRLRQGVTLEDGRYLLIEEIGHGGFGTVWSADDREGRERVAIKVLHADLADDASRCERFFRGARVMARLGHEAVVRVLNPRGDDRGYLYFVMELVSGGDLHRAVVERQVTRDRAISVVLGVGEALTEAHAKGIVHRDVKPANILLDAAGAPRLTDFDLVAVGDTTGGTRTGAAMGTYLYMAPEQMRSAKGADARADVYGLGMTALFCLHGSELPEITLRRPEKVIEGLGCSDAVKAALTKAIEVDPADRFPDVRAFCEALRESHVESTESRLITGIAGTPPVDPRPQPAPLLRPRIFAVGVLAVSVGVGTFIWRMGVRGGVRGDELAPGAGTPPMATVITREPAPSTGGSADSAVGTAGAGQPAPPPETPVSLPSVSVQATQQSSGRVQPAGTPPSVAPTPPPPASVALTSTHVYASDEVDVRAMRISCPALAIPPEARAAQVYGIIVAKCEVTERGATGNCRILKAPPFMEYPALEAFGRCQYKPAMHDGKPVSTEVAITARVDATFDGGSR